MPDDIGLQDVVDHGAEPWRPEETKQLVNLKKATLTPAQWAAADILEPLYALGAVIGFDVRAMLIAPTGVGKTMFAMALAVAAYLGRDFLHWRASGNPMRVLFVDAEMPKTLMQQRIRAAFSWFGEDWTAHEDGVFFLSREDFEDMPPLDTSEGQTWFSDVFAQLKPDFAFFDNLMSLTAQSLKDDLSWQAMKPWLLGLRCGWCLVHHTGIDASRGYGDKAKEWHLDTVLLMKAVEDSYADVAFDISFTKCRRRTPDNREDFEKRRLELSRGQWTSGEVEQDAKSSAGVRLTDLQRAWFDCLKNAICDHGTPLPATKHFPKRKGVKVEVWRKECANCGLIDAEKTRRQQSATFSDFRTKLQSKRAIGVRDGWAWLS